MTQNIYIRKIIFKILLQYSMMLSEHKISEALGHRVDHGIPLVVKNHLI